MSEERKTGSQCVDDPETIPLEEIPLHSTNLLTLLDESGTVRYESPSIEHLYGFDQEELVGDAVAEYFHPADRERVVDAFRTLVASGERVVESVEYRHRQADGTYRWVESVGSSSPTPDGYYVINTCDISERKQRERELERANERLETFANIVSHDLRNPLGVAQGHLELANEDAPGNHHSKIADALDRMESLIDGLLRNAQAETRELETEPVDLDRLCAECWQNLLRENATLDVAVDRSIQADRFQLTQLLENLYRNAIEHGGEDVTVTVGELDGGFFLADDGTGIPADESDRVFEVGYSNSEGGTGLGLAIVNRVAESHGWDLDVATGAAGGARFEITGVDFAE